MTLARVCVSVVVEVELETDATDDAQFLDQVKSDPDVRDALAYLVGGALDYRKSAESRANHKIHFTRLSLEPRQIGWSTL